MSTGKLHPNGQRLIPISSVAEVYACLEIPLQTYRRAGVKVTRGWKTMVTAAQVQAASDQWDGEGILEDIRTDWGGKPEGGTYNDLQDY